MLSMANNYAIDTKSNVIEIATNELFEAIAYEYWKAKIENLIQQQQQQQQYQTVSKVSKVSTATTATTVTTVTTDTTVTTTHKEQFSIFWQKIPFIVKKVFGFKFNLFISSALIFWF